MSNLLQWFIFRDLLLYGILKYIIYFRCDEKSLEDSLCQRVIVTPDGNITKPLDPDSAVQSRDALAKTVYSRLFDW